MPSPKVSEKQKLCISCRKCCEAVGIYIDPENYIETKRELARFYRARGFHVTTEDGLLYLTIDFPCPNLTKRGCAIYERRPRICKTYSGLDDFREHCLWSKLPEHRNKKNK
ncbi:MAG: YkgJ family cysteine cluster protein [Nitrospirota bacterium]